MSTITINTVQLKRLLQDAAEAGAQRALENLAPKENLITKNELIRWLKRLGKPATYIKLMSDEGLIKPHKTGQRVNSPVLFRRSDVQTAIQALNLFPIINN